MKEINFIIIGVVILLASNIVAISTYDYFYDMKMEECDLILSSEYQVSTSSATTCYQIQVNKFWNYDVGYYTTANFLAIFSFAFLVLIISIRDLLLDLARY